MSVNTYGDIDSFRRNPYAFHPDDLDNEEEIDWFTHSRTDSAEDLLPGSAKEDVDYGYGEGLGYLADETLDDDPDLLADA